MTTRESTARPLTEENAALRRQVAELEAERRAVFAERERHEHERRALAEAVAERDRAQDLTRTRLYLSEIAATRSLAELLRETLDGAERLTDSLIGFYHFVEPDQRTLALQAWSTRTVRDFCTAAGAGAHYGIDEAGVWVDCVRARRAVVHNDYASLPGKRGLPPGHAPIVRELVVPILREGSVVAVLGVGNKPTVYTEADVGALTDLANAAWEIAERKRAEEALRRSDAKFRAVVENGPIGILLCDAHATVTYRSPSYGRLHGFGDEERLGKSGFDTVHPDDVAAVRELWAQMARRPGSIVHAEHRARHKDGTWRWIESTAQNLLAHPDIGEVVITSEDVTERRRAVDALRESEERYRALFSEATPVPLCMFPRDGSSMSFNQRFQETFGYTREDIGTLADWHRLAYPDPEYRRQVAEDSPMEVAAPSGGLARLGPAERRVTCKDGRVLSGVMSGTSFGDTFVVAFFDLTELHEAADQKAHLEDQLHHAQKMEAIGTLAGGVAHDFNNILGGVAGGLSLLELGLGEAGAPFRQDLEDMKSLVQRGADLAKQLLAIGRRGKYDVRPIDLAGVARRTAQMFGRTRRDITITLDFPPDLDAALIDQTQLEQILLNLLLNAGHAMPEGGRLALRARNAVLAEAETAVHGVRPGRFVKLGVADSGVGMDAATQARIFEPFFTTKGPDQGSGLGLASVYGIVQNHGGIISVTSAPGEGSEFTLLLPASDLPASRPAERVEAPRGARGTILLVDDEPLVLRLGGRLLRAMGLEVLTASGGREAIEIVRREGARVSLVILDLTMPEMSGAKTFEALRELAPTLKVLLASGYSAEGQAQELLQRGCDGFVQKPFDRTTLAAKLESLL